jgi:hypothetical protein
MSKTNAPPVDGFKQLLGPPHLPGEVGTWDRLRRQVDAEKAAAGEAPIERPGTCTIH